MTLSLIGRGLRPLGLSSPASTRGVASLSGIHHGLRRSDKAHPQGPKRSDDTKPLTFRQRQEARKALVMPAYKIRKGKKDITEYPGIEEHPGQKKQQSRRARFFDPDSSFGKKSLVYQAKTGQLPKELQELRSRQGASDIFSQKIRPHGDLEAQTKQRASRTRVRPRSDFQARGLPGTRASYERGGPRGAKDDLEGSRDPTEQKGRPPSADYSRPIHRDLGRRPRADSSRPVRDFEQRGNTLEEARERRPPREHPISVPYTTAVSQFLYGKSVVEAALKGERRKLYKLYIYRGRDAQAPRGRERNERTAEDASIEHLAAAKGVKVVILREDGLRLMDKMSGGRPHNNYVLEASPLPQLPVTALGPLSQDQDKPGFSVDLGHQSAEEAAITGTSDFVSMRAGKGSSKHKPLVVLLHGVLDPGNLGAILRSASFLGATAVATTKRGSASLTPVALKAAAGASEAMTLLSVDSVEGFLNRSRDSGWAVYAAVPPPANGRYSRPHVDMRELEEKDPLKEKPCILLLGSEGEGLTASVRRKADFDVHIPNVLGSEMVDSLNVSVAAGLLCHAFLRGKTGEKAAQEKEFEDKFTLF